MLSALVEEAVSVGDLVTLFSFRQGNADLVEITLASDSPAVAKRVGSLPWPQDTALVAIVRGSRVIAPSADDTIEAGDELIFVCAPDQEPALQALISTN
jgi:trk system potassium uptake protein TrkA